jgi:hypothetical protein
VVRFYLDGIEMESPLNWVDFNLNLKRDKSIDALLLVSDTTLEWMGSGYVYLVNLIESDGFCGFSELLVTDDESPELEIFKGRIFLSATEIDEGICTIKTKVEDRSFYAMINNNKSIEADLTAGLSKGKLAITPVDDYMIDCHTVTTNMYKRTVYSVRVYEAFRYLVEFMTDGVVQFTSDTFDAGGEWEGLCITTGLKLRGATGPAFNNPPLTQFSFKELYEEVRKKIPIGVTIDEAAGVYTVRIESIDYFNQSSGAFAFENIDKIRTKFNEDKLYASIRVGSNAIDQSLTFPETQPIIGYREEQLFNNINCNIDNELDLLSEWIISSNVIEDCVTNLSGYYDEDLFLITTTYVNDFVGICTATDVFQSGSDWFYNDALRNINVLQRYANGIPASALQSFNGTPADFYAWQTTTLTRQRIATVSSALVVNNAPTGTFVNDMVIFDDDTNPPGSDPNGVYLTTVGAIGKDNVFTAPADAYYTFQVFVDATLTGNVTGTINAGGISYLDVNSFGGAGSVFIFLEYNTYTPANVAVDINVPIGTISTGNYKWKYTANQNNSGPYLVNNTNQVFSFSKYLLAGWRLNIDNKCNFNNFVATNSGAPTGTITITENVNVAIGSFFTCIGNSTNNTNIVVGDINEYIAYEHSFDYPMTASEFLYVKNNPRDLVAFSMFGKADRYGWISDLKYNWNKGTATVKLESNAINNA